MRKCDEEGAFVHRCRLRGSRTIIIIILIIILLPPIIIIAIIIISMEVRYATHQQDDGLRGPEGSPPPRSEVQRYLHERSRSLLRLFLRWSKSRMCGMNSPVRRIPTGPICAKAGLWPYPCHGRVELQDGGHMKGSFLCEEHAFQAQYKETNG